MGAVMLIMPALNVYLLILAYCLLLQCGDIESNPGPSIEYDTMVSCASKIVEGISRNPKGLAVVLFGKSLISQDLFERTIKLSGPETDGDKARVLYSVLLKVVEHYPEKYKVFTSSFDSEPTLYSDLVEELADVYQQHRGRRLSGSQASSMGDSVNEGLRLHIHRSGSLTASDISSPPSSPLSLSSVSSLSSSLSMTGSIKSKQVDRIFQKNLTVTKRRFFELVCKIKTHLKDNTGDVETFRAFLQLVYRDGLVHLDFKDIDSVFNYFINGGDWDFMHFDILSEAIELFKDASLKQAEKEYQHSLSGFYATTKISDFIEEFERRDRLTRPRSRTGSDPYSKQKPSNARTRSSKGYRDKLSLKLDVNVEKHTMQYIESLWKELSQMGIQKIGVILDRIIENCMWLIWTITLEIISEDIRMKVQEPEVVEFLKEHKIVQVWLNGECLYIADGEKKTGIPTGMSKRIVKQSTSESIEEEPEETELLWPDFSNDSMLTDEQRTEMEYTKDTGEHQLEPINEGLEEGESKVTSMPQISMEGTEHQEESGSVESGKPKSTEEQAVDPGDGDTFEDPPIDETDQVKSKQEDKEVSGGVVSQLTGLVGKIAKYNPFRRKPVSEKLLEECRKKTPDIDKIKGYLEDEDCDVNIREDDDFKWSPLMWACENKHFEIAKLILKHQPQVNIEDKKEWSPLVLASRAGDLEVVQGVVALGAVIDKPTNKKWTPLMWAAQEGHADVARFLLEKGAFVDYPDENGWTPLMQACQEGHVNVINALLDHNAKVNHQSHTTWCALMAATKNKHSEAVETLLKRGADVDILRDDGSTALQVASYYENNSAVMDALIKHNANVDLLNKDGMTALMLATTKGHLDLVQTLIRGGADIDKQHPETGWTAVFFAVKSGKVEIFKELLYKGAKTEIEGRNVSDVASMFRSGRTIIAELKKFEEAQKRRISSHVPTLEPSTPMQLDPVTTGQRVEVSSDEGEHQQEPTQEEKTTELSDPGTPIDKPTPQPTIESVPTPVTSGKTTEVQPTPDEKTKPEVKPVDKENETSSTKKNELSTTTSETAAKKTPKDLKREAQFIELILKNLDNRMANTRSYRQTAKPKGVPSFEKFTHKETETIGTSESYKPVDPL